MAEYWIKLYHEILNDPKMATLPDRLWRRATELFLLAGKYDNDGHLPETKQIAWELHMTTAKLDLDLRQIAMTGIIHQEEGGWYVENFSKRQGPSPVKERVKQFREREKKQKYYENVTEMKRGVTQIQITDTDIDTDIDIDVEATPAKPFRLFMDAFINATHLPESRINPQRALDAIDEMTKAGVTVEDMTRAIDALMNKGGYSISGPWSVINASCIQMTQRLRPAKPAAKENSMMSYEEFEKIAHEAIHGKQ